MSRCSSICVSKSSTAALSPVTSSLSGERKGRGKRETERGGGREGEGGREEREKEKERVREG